VSKKVRSARLAGTLVAVGAPMAVGLAACSSSSPTSTTKPTSTTAPGTAAARLASGIGSVLTSKVNRSFGVLELTSKNKQVQSVFGGKGTLQASTGDWAINALPSRVTDLSYQDKILDVGGVAYTHTPSLTVAMPHAQWVTISGPITELVDGPVLPLALTARMVAEFSTAPGVHWTSSKATEMAGQKVQLYTASLSATAALNAISAGHESKAYQQVAKVLFDGRTVSLYASLSHAGSLVAFGYELPEVPNYPGFNITYYPIAPPAAAFPTARVQDVVTLPAFVKALFAYNQKATGH
jgi:hypothetical protein